jgi:hypothetical protein
MSRKLLLALNGTNNGTFRRWLDEFQGEPRIAWYPSAGQDFRDLLYLNPQYSKVNPASHPDPQAPDIFLHTDYFPWSTSTFLDDINIYLDERTNVGVRSIEELPPCRLPLDHAIVAFPKGSLATGRVLFLDISVCSETLGIFSAPVVYAFVENEAFCARRILPLGGALSHIVHVRYGGGCGGGGQSSGVWLKNILKKVRCDCFITDGHGYVQRGDERTWALYPELAEGEDPARLQVIRTIPSNSWSGHGDVSWNIVKQS